MNNKIAPMLILFVALGGIGLLLYPSLVPPNEPTNLGPFASCLKEKGVTFYGAFWCPHCAAQKKLFGNAVSQLPYVECSTPDGQGQLPTCTEKGVKSYPTWMFPDGTALTGETPLQTLADKSGCTLPK